MRYVLFVGSETHTVAELTAMLGLVPDESWELGTPYRLGSKMKRRQMSAWTVVEPRGEDDDPIETAERLVTRLRALVPRFQSLPSGVEVSPRILVNDNSGVVGVGLDKSHVQVLAAIGANLDVSVALTDGNNSASIASDGSK